MAVLKLSRGYALSGTVRGPAGDLLTNATVFVGFDRYMSGAIKTNTDAGGQFDLKNLSLGDNYLTFSADGYAPDFRTVTVTATNAPLDVTLKPGRTIHGRVVDSAGPNRSQGAAVSYDGLADRKWNFQRTYPGLENRNRHQRRILLGFGPGPASSFDDHGKAGYMGLEWTKVQTETTNETASRSARH